MQKMHFTLPHYFTILAFILTGFNILSGFLGIYFSLNGELTIAFQFLLLGTLFDLLDGKVAKRAPTGTSNIGAYADSFGDLITFAVLPGYMLLGLGSNLWLGNVFLLSFPIMITLGQIIAAVFAIGGWYRLVRFGALPDSSTFEGLPTAAAAMFIGAFTVIVYEFNDLPFNILLTFATLVCGFLMASNISYPSPKRLYRSDNILITAATVVSSLYLIYPNFISALFIVIEGFLYIAGGPSYVQKTKIIFKS